MNAHKFNSTKQMALTQAYHDETSQYQNDCPLEMGFIQSKNDPKVLKSANHDLKKTIKINKQIIAGLISDNDKLKSVIETQKTEQEQL